MLLPSSHSFRPVLKYRAKKYPRAVVAADAPAESADIPAKVDTSKRTFLRLASLAGLGVVASQMLPKRAEASGSMSGVVRVKNHSNAIINPITESGNLTVIAGKIPAQGRATMNASMPVATASNQTKLPTKVSDGSGNAITSTSSALNLNIRSGSSEISYTANSFANSAQGRLMMGRYGTKINALQTDAQGNLKVDDTDINIQSINGELIPTLSPGVLPTTLVDMGGLPLETFGGNLQVKVSNPQDMSPQVLDAPITGSGQGVGQFIIKPIYVSGYAVGYLQVGGTFSATYNFEGSNSILNNAWAAIPARNLTLGTIVTSNTVAGQYEVPFSFKYFRVRISVFASGFPQATLRLSPLSTATNNQYIGYALAGADGITANVTAPNVLPSTGATAPLQVMAHYNNTAAYDISDEIVDGKNSATGGNRAAGMLAQLSEVPIVRSGASLNIPVGTIITERQFGNLRMSADRSLNVDIKSADNSGRGVNLTALSEVRVQNTVEAETLQQILDATNVLHDDLLAVQPNATPLIDQYSRYVGVLGTIAQNISTASITITASTAETSLITGIPGKYAHIRSIAIANTDATNSSSVALRDTISGVVVHQWQVPTKSTQYVDGGKGVFLPQTGAGNSWTITCGTSTSSILVSVTYEVA